MAVKALILNSSGNSTGCTISMCQTFHSVLSGAGWDSEMIDLASSDVGDCTGCGICRAGHECVIDDGMQSLYGKIGDSDLLVFATPIRFNGPSSIMKRFMDRMNPYWGFEKPHPAYSCGLMCGGSIEPNFSHARSEMKSVANTVGMEWIGEVCISGTDSDDVDLTTVVRFAEHVLEVTRV